MPGINTATVLRPLSFAVLCLSVAVATLAADSGVQYRGIALGSTSGVVSAHTGVGPEALRTRHARPALLQDLEWRPSRWVTGSNVQSTDAVEQISFSFYDDQLYRVVAEYDRSRTMGMTDADMVEAISLAYGERLPRGATAGRAVRIDDQFGVAVARWGGDGGGVVLYRPNEGSYRLVVTHPGLDARAEKASLEAQRLDELEAPQREREREQADSEARRQAADAARLANRSTFQP
jgi:hypothetical protein